VGELLVLREQREISSCGLLEQPRSTKGKDGVLKRRKREMGKKKKKPRRIALAFGHERGGKKERRS